MLNSRFVNRIISEVRQIESEYQNNKGLILSEDDLKCLIYSRIYGMFPNVRYPTLDDDITGSPLHSEIPFYDSNGKLRIKPDITIFDPSEMSIKHGVSMLIRNNKFFYGSLPTKEFEFAGKAIVIEIKFIKKKRGLSFKDTEKIKIDIDKILGLMNRRNRPNTDNNIYGIMVVFNKTSQFDESFGQLLERYRNNNNPRLVYGTGNVRFQ